MRDHYYQLWDIEKNFGEKTLCDDSGKNSKINLNYGLESILFGGQMDRKFSTGSVGAEKPPKLSVAQDNEKPTDRWGFGVGKESTPHPTDVNDCCILNLDEKFIPIEKTLRKKRDTRQNLSLPQYNCGKMRVKLKGVERSNGGRCKFIQIYKTKGEHFCIIKLTFEKHISKILKFHFLLTLGNIVFLKCSMTHFLNT